MELTIVSAAGSACLKLITAIEQAYKGCKAIAAFPGSYQTIQFQLNLQWRAFENLVRGKPISEKQLVGGRLRTADEQILLDYLKEMEDHFSACNKLVKKYTGQEGRAVLPPHFKDDTDAGEGSSNLGRPASSSPPKTDIDGTQQLSKEKKSMFGWAHKLVPKKKQGKTRKHGVDTIREDNGNNFQTDENTPTVPGPSTSLAYDAQNLRGVMQLRRIPFVAFDKDSFEKHLEIVSKCNAGMALLFEQTKLSHHNPKLGIHDEADRLRPLMTKLQGMITRLHRDLAQVNPSRGQKPAVFDLTLELLNDHTKARDDFVLYPEIQQHLRDQSSIFSVQKHEDGVSTPKLLLLECAGSNSKPVAAPQRASELKSLQRPPVEDIQALDEMEFWGKLPHCDRAYGEHVVFHAMGSHLEQVGSLLDILKADDYRAKMLPMQIAQLAQLVVSAHLYLEDIRNSCTPLRPANFVFYLPVAASRTWNDAEPLALCPWLACGFGRRKKPKQFGSSTGFEDNIGTAALELGILLFQIGSAEPVEYGAGRPGLIQARDRCIRDLNLLDRRVSSQYTSIVRSLLEIELIAPNLRTADHIQRTYDRVLDALSALYSLEVQLEGTIANPVVIEEPHPAVETLLDVPHAPVLHTDPDVSCGASDRQESQHTLVDMQDAGTVCDMPQTAASSMNEGIKPAAVTFVHEQAVAGAA